jgi:hypothetical protein
MHPLLLLILTVIVYYGQGVAFTVYRGLSLFVCKSQPLNSSFWLMGVHCAVEESIDGYNVCATFRYLLIIHEKSSSQSTILMQSFYLHDMMSLSDTVQGGETMN